jgi:hypothetical protein
VFSQSLLSTTCSHLLSLNYSYNCSCGLLLCYATIAKLLLNLSMVVVAAIFFRRLLEL